MRLLETKKDVDAHFFGFISQAGPIGTCSPCFCQEDYVSGTYGGLGVLTMLPSLDNGKGNVSRNSQVHEGTSAGVPAWSRDESKLRDKLDYRSKSGQAMDLLKQAKKLEEHPKVLSLIQVDYLCKICPIFTILVVSQKSIGLEDGVKDIAASFLKRISWLQE